MNLKIATTTTMAASKLSLQDRKDLERFTKMLASKTVQIIVQSRLGEKIKTKSKPQSANTDWFNLTIEDNPEIALESKRAFASLVPTLDVAMCVEISVKTTEGDTMVLELWQLEMLEQCDASVHVAVTVYNRIGQMLKSLISISRVLPCYRLSAYQSSNSYVVCYRVFMGEPDHGCLGVGQQGVRIGHVGTPLGTLSLSVAYRMLMAMPPKCVPNYNPFILKSDHFKPDLSPKRPRNPSHQTNFPLDGRSLVDELAAASEDYRVATSPQNLRHILSNGVDRKPGKHFSKDRDSSPTSAWDKHFTFRDWKKVGAFAPETVAHSDKEAGEYFVPEVPFSSLLQAPPPPPPPTSAQGATANTVTNHCNIVANKNCANMANNNAQNASPRGGAAVTLDDLETCSVASDDLSQKSGGSITSGAEDFVLVELKTPFGVADRTTDLGVFFRECQSAPPLLSFTDQPSSLVEQVNDLSVQLATFEVNQHDFDNFVESLCHDDGAK